MVVSWGEVENYSRIPCSFFGEGEGEDMRGIDVFLFNHVCILGCDGRSLASLRL